MFQTVVFDFDGTLVDTSEGIFYAVNHALEAMGKPRDDDRASLSRMIGPPISEGFARFYGINDPAVVTAFRACYSTEGLTKSVGYPGMESLLLDLKRRGVRVGIATIKPAEFTRVILNHLGWTDYIDCLVGAPMDGSNNDKAKLVEQVLQELGNADPATAVMIGDRQSDIIGGRKNNLYTVYCRYGFGKPGEAEAVCADAIADDVEGLQSILL